MNIRQVKIKNFRGYGINKNTQDGFFIFDNLDKYDIVILSGYNGYGKTSFYDAIEWCLTDEIKRLVDLDNIFKMGRNYLKKSDYIKFNGLDSECEKAEVSIKFVHNNEEVFIKRVTYCNNFQESDYASTCYNKYGEVMSLGEFQDIINLFSRDLGGGNVSNLEAIQSKIRSNFLGQERMNAFLRLTKPNERTKAIFNLVGFNNITDILELSKGAKLNNVKKLRNEINDIQNQYNICKDNIESWFKIKGFGDFNTYFSKVNNDVLIINENLDILKIQFKNFNLTRELSEKNISQTIDNYIKYQERVKNYKNSNKERIEKFLKVWYIKRLDYINTKLLKIEYIDKNSSKLENKNKETYEWKLKFFNEKIKQAENFILDFRKYLQITDISRYKIRYDYNFNSEIDPLQYENLFLKIDEFYKKYNFFGNGYNIDIINKFKDKLNKQIYEMNKKIIQVISLQKDIKDKKVVFKNITNNNSQYNDVLNRIREIIINKKMQYCPICKNDKFESFIKDKAIVTQDKNAQLLQIINETISQGNKNIYRIQKSINDEEKSINDIKELLKKKIHEVLIDINKIKDTITNDYIYLSKYFDIQINCLKQCINFYNRKLKDIKVRIEEYKSDFQEIQNECNIKIFKRETRMRSLFSMYGNLKNYYVRVLKDKYGMFDTSDKSIKNTANISDNKENISKLLHNINCSKKILSSFINLKEFKMNQEEKDKFNLYIKLKNKSENISKLYKTLCNRINSYDTISKNIKLIEENLISSLVEENPLAMWIYKQINPHPLYRKFKFKINGIDTNIVAEKNERIYLDHIFSSAQLNVLALSIFLGFSLMRGSSSLNQLFIDDPIQNMDDYNILSVIDIFRSITDKKINKKIIISTHDEDFKNLLAVKFRKRKCKIFDFAEYDKSGPIINEID